MSIFLNPIFILTTAFMAFVAQVMWNNWFDVPLLTDGTSTETETAVTRNLNLLQSHPRCGLTSGGREECWWGCDRKSDGYGSYYFRVILNNLQLPLWHYHSSSVLCSYVSSSFVLLIHNVCSIALDQSEASFKQCWSSLYIYLAIHNLKHLHFDNFPLEIRANINI